MKRLGFIHDMMDVKVLILFVTARSNYPMTNQEIYELCYQDECLSYFDVCAALPEMVESGHLEVAEDKYTITEKVGRTALSRKIPWLLLFAKAQKMLSPSLTGKFAEAVM